MAFNANVIVKSTVGEGIKRYTAEQNKLFRGTMKKGCIMLQSDAKGRLKWRERPGKGLGGRATGALARIPYEVKSGKESVEGTVGIGVTYGPYVEGWNSRGEHVPTVRHFLPFVNRAGQLNEGLYQWAMRHGLLIWQSRKTGRMTKRPGKYGSLSGGLMVGGEQSTTPFLEPAADATLPKILQMFQQALAVKP